MEFPSDHQLLQAIPLRHSVRKYRPVRVPAEIVECLKLEVGRINARCGFSFSVVTDEPRSFKNIFAYGKFENVVNYIIVSGPKGEASSRECGVEGERLVLALQAMGLNTCWVGLSYSKTSPAFAVPEGHKVRCVISFGYGQTQGRDRKTKSMEQLSNANADSPLWFRQAIHAVQLAPTAINQQKFHFALQTDGTVTSRSLFSLVGYTHIDLGIAICHFNLSAPPEHRIH